MQKITIHQLLKDHLVGQTVTVKGWVKTKRDSKAGLSFIQLNDGSTLHNLQVVAESNLNNYASEIAKLTSGCAIAATGTVVESQGKHQSVEMQATQIDVIGIIEEPDHYPISPKRHSYEYLREVAHFRPRTNTFGAVARLRNQVSQTIHQYLNQEGFIWVHTPIITANDCEGAGELFRVSTLSADHSDKDFSKDFFGQESFLTVSGQLNVEAYACALSKVYTFGPTFRAENSNTSRHLAEFWMIEPEIAFADLQDTFQFAEKMLKEIFSQVLSRSEDDMNFFAKYVDKECIERLDQVINAQFEVINYTQAIKTLEKSNQAFEYPVAWGLDLQSEHERFLTEKIHKKPIIITDYPKDIKGFYMRQNSDGKTVAAFDVLVPGVGEIIGGSQREERHDFLQARMQTLGINEEHLDWYLSLRKFGSAPHGGFGLGLERLLGYISGLSNVRDLIPFPRTPKHVRF